MNSSWGFYDTWKFGLAGFVAYEQLFVKFLTRAQACTTFFVANYSGSMWAYGLLFHLLEVDYRFVVVSAIWQAPLSRRAQMTKIIPFGARTGFIIPQRPVACFHDNPR